MQDLDDSIRLNAVLSGKIPEDQEIYAILLLQLVSAAFAGQIDNDGKFKAGEEER